MVPPVHVVSPRHVDQLLPASNPLPRFSDAGVVAAGHVQIQRSAVQYHRTHRLLQGLLSTSPSRR